MGNTYYPLADRISYGDVESALADLEALDAPESHTDLLALHRWFQVSTGKLRCYTKLKRLEDARAIASRMISVSPENMAAMVGDYPVAGFSAALIQFMRLVDQGNFMTNPALQPYRDFLDLNLAVDGNRHGARVYALYKLGVDAAWNMRQDEPAMGPTLALLDALTPDNISLLQVGHMSLLFFAVHMLSVLTGHLPPESEVVARVKALTETVLALPRG
jgi:hypothetical protein